MDKDKIIEDQCRSLEEAWATIEHLQMVVSGIRNNTEDEGDECKDDHLAVNEWALFKIE